MFSLVFSRAIRMSTSTRHCQILGHQLKRSLLGISCSGRSAALSKEQGSKGFNKGLHGFLEEKELWLLNAKIELLAWVQPCT